jgi:hypothetical protein
MIGIDMRLSTAGYILLQLIGLLLAACGSADEEAALAETGAADPVAVDDAPVAEADLAAGFGTVGEVTFAEAIWAALEAASLVGDQAIHAPFYEGAEPHGYVLETLFAEISVFGNIAPVVVKRNYGPVGVIVGDVANDPVSHLEAITVMYRRPGFNAETDDWFWVKYLPGGTLDVAGDVPMAGNVTGCIGCHQGAPGDDWIFVTDRELAEPRAANPGPEDALADPDNCRPGDNDCNFGG